MELSSVIGAFEVGKFNKIAGTDVINIQADGALAVFTRLSIWRCKAWRSILIPTGGSIKS